jgi:cytochrome c oxidase subunit IV
MSHTATHEEHSGGGTKEIIKVTIILSVLTVVELILGFWMMGFPDSNAHGTRLAIKGTIIILMMAKAFYIVAFFMHLKHEIKNLIMTICVPLALFIWFITAFLYDGNSFRNLRNNFDPHYKEQATIKVEKKEAAEEKETKHDEKHEEKHEAKKEGYLDEPRTTH